MPSLRDSREIGAIPTTDFIRGYQMTLLRSSSQAVESHDRTMTQPLSAVPVHQNAPVTYPAPARQTGASWAVVAGSGRSPKRQRKSQHSIPTHQSCVSRKRAQSSRKKDSGSERMWLSPPLPLSRSLCSFAAITKNRWGWRRSIEAKKRAVLRHLMAG